MRCIHWYWQTSGQVAKSEAVTALCKVHDGAYHPGGTATERVVADAVLMIGIARIGNPFLARLMVMAVGVFGHPLLPFSWRWGYGWRWPRGYHAET